METLLRVKYIETQLCPADVAACSLPMHSKSERLDNYTATLPSTILLELCRAVLQPTAAAATNRINFTFDYRFAILQSPWRFVLPDSRPIFKLLANKYHRERNNCIARQWPALTCLR